MNRPAAFPRRIASSRADSGEYDTVLGDLEPILCSLEALFHLRHAKMCQQMQTPLLGELTDNELCRQCSQQGTDARRILLGRVSDLDAAIHPSADRLADRRPCDVAIG